MHFKSSSEEGRKERMKINIDLNFLLSGENKTKSENDENFVIMNDNKMIENPYKISNYEIIGDFGKELEKEMGLIMAEYSIMNDTNLSPDDFLKLKNLTKNYSQSRSLSKLSLNNDHQSTHDTIAIRDNTTPTSHLSNAVLHSKILQKMRNASCDELTEQTNYKDFKNCINMIGNNCYFNDDFRRDSIDDFVGCKGKFEISSNKNFLISSEMSEDEECSSDSDTCPNLKNFPQNTLAKPRTLTTTKMECDDDDVFDEDSSQVFTNLARLQIEARMALSQSKNMAKMQVEIERQKQGSDLITKLVHQTLNKVLRRLPNSKRRLSRCMLSTMNITQLQIIINDFHEFINVLNEILVLYLMERDELSMKQDSVLIDIEDITKYIGDKTQYGAIDDKDS